MSGAQGLPPAHARDERGSANLFPGLFPNGVDGDNTGTLAWLQQDDVPGTDVCLYHRGKRVSACIP